MDEHRYRILYDKLDRLESLVLKVLEKQTVAPLPQPNSLPETGGIKLAQQITGFKKSTIYKMTSTGQIPFSKPSSGKLIFVSKTLLDWVSSHSRSTSDD